VAERQANPIFEIKFERIDNFQKKILGNGMTTA